ncbi:Zinc finger protein [Wickerhamomyces ciferrii]|uniref:Zinc finger protein n=1 Tax=Wickerhamomyces ciferrii (strain ATCC 14091 / BCRC 22168 / CBS 111 / JCM 3599 / NBRC 0793 / NRRL Y-1031 F-60-10) TaxID=1206466 RepID=K0KCR7_WICCF|nr:Zinc finger protein [Wickerhamomyces ciferrii]CCH42880.1 Zinc finger protein [Wickerhamomyces ciferrii]
MMSSILRKQSQRPKKFHCDFQGCTKSYTRPCLLEQHIRTHSNERPFKCPECPKSFFRDSHLKVHTWTHSDEKPLKCSTCSKGFVTSQQLSRHMKKHLKQEGQSTDKAIDQSTDDSSDQNSSSAITSPLNNNNNTNDKNKTPITYQCPYECEESFHQEKLLSEHMLSEHVMNDIIDEKSHKLHNEVPTTQIAPSPLDIPDIKDVLTPEMYEQLTKDASNVKKIEDFNQWDNHSCKEPICDGYPSFESYQDLIFHYDHFHRFIPESLYEILEFDEESTTSSNSNSNSSSDPNSNPSSNDFQLSPHQLNIPDSLQFPQIIEKSDLNGTNSQNFQHNLQQFDNKIDLNSL